MAYRFYENLMCVLCLFVWRKELKLWSDLQAAALKIAEQYVEAFGNIAKQVRAEPSNYAYMLLYLMMLN